MKSCGAAHGGTFEPSGFAGHQIFYLFTFILGMCFTLRRLPRILVQERRRSTMFRGDRGGGCWLLGICAVALGAGILIAAIFPVGALMFLVAVLLIACGCACCRR